MRRNSSSAENLLRTFTETTRQSILIHRSSELFRNGSQDLLAGNLYQASRKAARCRTVPSAKNLCILLSANSPWAKTGTQLVSAAKNATKLLLQVLTQSTKASPTVTNLATQPCLALGVMVEVVLRATFTRSDC